MTFDCYFSNNDWRPYHLWFSFRYICLKSIDLSTRIYNWLGKSTATESKNIRDEIRILLHPHVSDMGLVNPLLYKIIFSIIMSWLKYPVGWLARRVIFPLLLCCVLSYWLFSYSGHQERVSRIMPFNQQSVLGENYDKKYLGNISTVLNNVR